ncbi:uncharacterized protein PHACADRAFT_265465 [Phanerochaete carnosa HHB-10118-sp]|uniref:Uncharacterized protein n=1 Tax=Phanerochaete carnosa (strain HHB-10118-sp) TaxID=650164 RepID=K5WHS6_PHACS|nr:uncharacterized protein PHACADRAFT_265465 [Phanerochaete carnosa HHB-10118-sp]EKM49782.1 hypothetical protein PHACADRAFT_265465 [Phanerochaete carnosa HHB-10118-sp]
MVILPALVTLQSGGTRLEAPGAPQNPRRCGPSSTMVIPATSMALVLNRPLSMVDSKPISLFQQVRLTSVEEA